MNKSHNFRRCSYCPHQPLSDIKKLCCCQSRFQHQGVKTKPRSRLKSKGKKQLNINQSTISYINSTLPITNNQNFPHFGSNILAQNSILRTENDLLKREISNQYYPVSAFTKDEKNNISTFPTSENETSRTYQLHDKLYASNRNLQEALIELDAISKINKELNQMNTKLQLEKSQLTIKNQQLIDEMERLRRKLKKLTKTLDNHPSQEELEKIYHINCKLEKQKIALVHQVQDLKEEIERNRNRNIVEVQSLSPQWVAHTSTKINAIERNISRLEEENKENSVPNFSILQDKKAEHQISTMKKQIIFTIKSLKIQSKSFKMGISAFDEIIDTSNPSLMLLIKTLCESLFEPLQTIYFQIHKGLDKELKKYENKFHKIIHQMENLVIKQKNGRLRDRSRSRITY